MTQGCRWWAWLAGQWYWRAGRLGSDGGRGRSGRGRHTLRCQPAKSRRWAVQVRVAGRGDGQCASTGSVLVYVLVRTQKNISIWLNNNIQLHFVMKHFNMTQWRVLCPHSHVPKSTTTYCRGIREMSFPVKETRTTRGCRRHRTCPVRELASSRVVLLSLLLRLDTARPIIVVPSPITFSPPVYIAVTEQNWIELVLNTFRTVKCELPVLTQFCCGSVNGRLAYPWTAGSTLIMIALWNRANHYIFILWFLLSSFFFSFLA